MNKDQVIKKVMEMTNIKDKMETEKSVHIVLSILSHRLLPTEAKDCESQLPEDLKDMWKNDVWITNFYKMSGKKMNFRHKYQLLSLIENELLRENLKIAPEIITKAVFHVLKELVSQGESLDIESGLPEEIRNFYKAA
ncbi:MAG: DUF2267 domain-containing protein [Candidatus Gastranaerophilaceae bacterium]|jgi:uncharacterized protein (DUF2267 family)